MQYELFANEEWGAEPPDDNGYFLQRYMLHGDITPRGWLRVFAEFKSGIERGRAGGPRPTDEDTLDLHQGFVETRVTPSRYALTIRGGRQELSYGSQRLISVRERPNVRQSFDALRGILEVRSWRVDAFVSRPVTTATGVFDDATDRRRALWGAYAVRADSASPSGLDLYYLGYRRAAARYAQGAANEVRHSLGARAWRHAGLADYNLEAVRQFGTFGEARIRAWTVASETGVRVRTANGPRIGLRADITSGDSNPNDRVLGTFNAMFPRGGYFGLVSPVGPSNHVDIHPQVSFTPRRNWAITGRWLFFWRQQTTDGIYSNAGLPLRGGANNDARFVGQSPGLEVEVTTARRVTFTANLAAFSAGPVVRTAAAGRTTALLAVWTTYRF